MIDLSGHQEGVGAVLEEGARLLSESGLNHEEADEVRLQMKLLNSRWEALRVNAMEKQSKYLFRSFLLSSCSQLKI